MTEPKIELDPDSGRPGLDPSIERACDSRYLVDIDEGSVVLDYLSLGGRLAAYLAAAAAKVICLAHEPCRAREAAADFRAQGASRVRVVCADPCRLPFRDAVFDSVLDIAVGKKTAPGEAEVAEIRRALKSSGSLACGRLSLSKFGAPQASLGGIARAFLLGRCGAACDVYAVIPCARDPRVFLPLSGVNPPSTYTRFFSERFFSAEKAKSRIARWLGMRPGLGSALLRFVPSRLLVASGRPDVGAGIGFVLRAATGSRELDLFALGGAWRGPDAPSSCAFMGFAKGRQEPTAIAKVGRNPAHNAVIDSEYRRLLSVREKVGEKAAASIPTGLGTGSVQGCRVAVYEWAGGDALSHLLKTAKPRDRMGIFESAFGKAGGFLTEVCAHTARRGSEPALPLGARDATAAQLAELAARERIRLGLSGAALEGLRESAGEGIGDVSCLSHGDFAPCNVQIDRTRIWVLDWELAAEGRSPMFDLASFLAHSLEDISPADSGLGLLTEAFDGRQRALSDEVHKSIFEALSAFGGDRQVWKRFFALYCAGEMLRDLLYFRLGALPRWRTALYAALGLV